MVRAAAHVGSSARNCHHELDGGKNRAAERHGLRRTFVNTTTQPQQRSRAILPGSKSPLCGIIPLPSAAGIGMPAYGFRIGSLSPRFSNSGGIMKPRGKVLRRCIVCKKYGAPFLVPEPESGKGYYCYECWKARHASQVVSSQPRQPSRHRQSRRRTG
jgi:hypothetical protein